MSHEVLADPKGEFTRSIGQMAVKEEYTRYGSHIKTEHVCTTFREGAKAGARLTIQAMQEAGVELSPEQTDRIHEIAQNNYNVNQNQGDD